MHATLDRAAPAITADADDQNYGSSATLDVAALQALSKRIHYGKFVAEAKFRCGGRRGVARRGSCARARLRTCAVHPAGRRPSASCPSSAHAAHAASPYTQHTCCLPPPPHTQMPPTPPALHERRAQTAEYTALIQARDAEGIMALLTDARVERHVVERVEEKAATFGQDINPAAPTRLPASSAGAPKLKVQPEFLGKLYEEIIMPLTKDVEVDYLLARLG